MSQKERIVDVALEMFLEQGAKAVRVDDIASELGVSKRTIYEIFIDKGNLLYECVLLYSQRERIKHIEIGKQSSNILEAMLLVLEHSMDSSDKVRRLQSDIAKFYPAVYIRLGQNGFPEERYRQMRESMMRGVEQGLLSPKVDLDLALSIHFFVLSGMFEKREINLPLNISPRDAFVFVVINFFRGIATEKGVAVIDEFLKQKQKRKININY